MSKNVLTPLNMNNLELQNARLHMLLSTELTATQEGLYAYDSTSHEMVYRSNDAWKHVACKEYVDAAVSAHSGDADVHVTADDKSRWNAMENSNHSHSNKDVLDTVTAASVENWNTAYGWGNHASQNYLVNASTSQFLGMSARAATANSATNSTYSSYASYIGNASSKYSYSDINGLFSRVAAIETWSNSVINGDSTKDLMDSWSEIVDFLSGFSGNEEDLASKLNGFDNKLSFDNVTLNGYELEDASMSIYAPVDSGEYGDVLVSQGEEMPPVFKKRKISGIFDSSLIENSSYSVSSNQLVDDDVIAKLYKQVAESNGTIRYEEVLTDVHVSSKTANRITTVYVKFLFGAAVSGKFKYVIMS